MKVVLTFKSEIASKKGDKYTIYRGITNTGDTVELFLGVDQIVKFAIPDERLVPPADLKEFLDQYRAVDVSFDQRGRIVEVVA